MGCAVALNSLGSLWPLLWAAAPPANPGPREVDIQPGWRDSLPPSSFRALGMNGGAHPGSLP